MQKKYHTIAAVKNRAHRYWISFLLIAVVTNIGSCGRLNDTMHGISPEYVINKFFESWKQRDWKILYTLVHPGFIQRIRMQKLSPEEEGMSDEELFIHQFKAASENNPGKALKSYNVKSITSYKPGDTTVWADTIVNGKKKRIPLTLDGLTLKVDLTRIE